MATGKPKSGAGPYAGYKKNYQPIKSSKGTKAENLVQKGLRAVAKDGSKTARVKGPDGKMRTVTVEQMGGLGKVVSSVAKNLLPKGGKVVPATNKRPPAWYAKPEGKIRGQGDLSTAAGRAKTSSKNQSKLESLRMPKEKAIAKTSEFKRSQILPKSVSNSKPSVPVKAKTPTSNQAKLKGLQQGSVSRNKARLNNLQRGR